jgi:hypothetical protein
MMSPEVKRLPIIAHIAIYAAIHRSSMSAANPVSHASV